MKRSIIHDRVSKSASWLAAACLCLTSQFAAAQFTYKVPLAAHGGDTWGEVIFTAPEFKNPGRSVLRTNFPKDGYHILRDDAGLLVSVTTASHVLSIRATDEEWAKSDPNAFTCRFSEKDGKLIRASTVAFVEINGVPRFVARSVWGNEITRIEQTSPSKGLLVLEKGIEKDGVFIAHTRESYLPYITEKNHSVIRRINERRPSPDQPWETLSDVQTETKYIAGGWKKLREIQDPEGDAITEVWEYYTKGEVTGPNGWKDDNSLIRMHRQPDGTEVRYQYGDHMKIEETHRPGQPVTRKTSLRDSETRTETTIDEVGGVETLRTIKQTGKDFRSETTIQPGGEPRTLKTEVMPYGADFGGQPRRIHHPDGTLTTYEYRRLPDSRKFVIKEEGQGDGLKVTKGTRETITYSFTGAVENRETKTIGD